MLKSIEMIRALHSPSPFRAKMDLRIEWSDSGTVNALHERDGTVCVRSKDPVELRRVPSITPLSTHRHQHVRCCYAHGHCGCSVW